MVVNQVVKKNLSCPKCSREMELFGFNGTDIDACPSCQGVWVSRAKEKQALNMKPVVFTHDDFLNFRRIYTPPEMCVEKVRYFKCPCCADFMHRKQFMHGSGIVVDDCRYHGAFFDKGKLNKAMEFVEKGGIEFAKFSLAKFEIEELRTRLFVGLNRIESNMFKLYWLGKT